MSFRSIRGADDDDSRDENEHAWPHRLWCEVMSEMRDIVDSLGLFTYRRCQNVLKAQLGEMQILANRMEAALSYEKDLEKLHNKRKRLIDEVNKLKAEKRALSPAQKKKDKEKRGTGCLGAL